MRYQHIAVFYVVGSLGYAGIFPNPPSINETHAAIAKHFHYQEHVQRELRGIERKRSYHSVYQEQRNRIQELLKKIPEASYLVPARGLPTVDELVAQLMNLLAQLGSFQLHQKIGPESFLEPYLSSELSPTIPEHKETLPNVILIPGSEKVDSKADSAVLKALPEQESSKRNSIDTQENTTREELKRAMSIGVAIINLVQQANHLKSNVTPEQFEPAIRTAAMQVNPFKRMRTWRNSMRCSESVRALEWEGEKANSEKMTFDQATAYAKKAKETGWRLPTIFELEALYQQKKVLGEDGKILGHFISITPVSTMPGYHWGLNLDDGNVSYFCCDKLSYFVRLVRG